MIKLNVDAVVSNDFTILWFGGYRDESGAVLKVWAKVHDLCAPM